MTQNCRPTVLKITPTPHARRFCGAPDQLCAARDGVSHGPRGGVVEVVRGCAANMAGTVVASDVTEPPVRLKYAYDGRRPRGAPYRAPAYPGEGGEGGNTQGEHRCFPVATLILKNTGGFGLICSV